MRVNKFLKENNVSFNRIKNILGYRLWDYKDVTLNTTLNQEDLSYLKEQIEKENYDEIHEKINLKREEKKLETQKLIDPIKIEEYAYSNDEIDLEIAIDEYYDLVMFLIMNYYLNFEKINSIYIESKKECLNEKLFNNNITLFDTISELFEELKENKNFVRSSRLFEDLVDTNMERYGAYSLIKNLFIKKKNPFIAAKIVLRYRKIHINFIEKYRYDNYPTYKKIVDFKNGIIIDEGKTYPISSKNSVFSTPHPFRN